MMKVPHFETEREEADWWFENRNQLEDAFSEALKTGARSAPSRVVKRLAEARGVSVEELESQMSTRRTQAGKTTDAVKLPRSA